MELNKYINQHLCGISAKPYLISMVEVKNKGEETIKLRFLDTKTSFKWSLREIPDM